MLAVICAIGLLRSISAAESNASADPAPRSRYDFVVYGSTPGGIACAVRAAREGLDVLLVTHADHIGGIFSSGLSTMDTLYNGARAPLYDEYRQAIYDYYRTKYGENSPQYKASLPKNPKTKFESHVAEQIFETMIKKEQRVTLVRGYYPVEARRALRALQSVTFRSMRGTKTFSVTGAAFADCSYEGDLLAVAKLPYRWGREAREEFDEEHAGRIFVRKTEWPPAHVDPAYLKEYWRLNLFHYERWYEIIRPQSTGASDMSVQAFNLRTMLTRNPANRVAIEKPAGYSREEVLRRVGHDINWSGTAPRANQPNDKTYINLPELVGVQNAYVEGDWEARRKVADEHRRMTLSLIYFAQTDESVPEERRRAWREWGLPRDEFAENGHVPWEIYVREARRLKGRFVFTENDARLAPRLKRAPVYGDSISITEWFLDSHACTPEELKGSLWEGELLLNNITFPGQIPFRSMLPQELDNVIVPVCASSSHIGWGAIRLEPTWMSMAEAAAHAVAMAARERTAPAEINPDRLVRLLAEKRMLLSFFNDIEGKERESWYPAVQYFGTQGFFGTYDARPDAPLTAALAEAWSDAAAELASRVDVDRTERARRMLAAETQSGGSILPDAFLGKLIKKAGGSVGSPIKSSALADLGITGTSGLTRGAACRIMFAALDPRGVASGPAAAAVAQAEFIYEKAPFRESHASTIAETSAGGLVTAWFGGTREGNPDVGIWVSRQESGRWTPPIEVANGVQADGTRHPTWNPVLFQPRGGPLLLFYKAGPSPSAWWGMLRTSTDGGKTWSEAQRLPEGVIGPVKNKPMQLPDGSLLCPSSTETSGGQRGRSEWRIHFERTPDLGKTWTKVEPPREGSEEAIQPSVLFHGGDVLQAVGRTRMGRVFTTWSRDGGKTWSHVQPTELPNPNSGTDAVTLKDGRHVLIYNHTARGRTPLCVAISKDGYTWTRGIDLETEPGEYSYPAVIQTSDGRVHITYTWKRERVKHVVLDPTKLEVVAVP